MGESAESPIDMARVRKAFLNKEILRKAIMAELDAISLYEELADNTDDPGMKEILLDVAKEEKTHVGEFQTLLLKIDKEQLEELENGRKEVERKLKILST